MEPFKLTLSDDEVVSALQATPKSAVRALFHQRAASSIGIPVIAINRPGTGASTPVPPPKNEGNDTAIQNNARWLHDRILPCLWRTYGVPSGATHRDGLSPNHNNDKALLPLSGLILSAFAPKTKPLPQTPFTPGPKPDSSGNATTLIWPQEALDETMLNVSQGHVSSEVLGFHTGMNGPVSVAEMTDMSAPHLWQSYWQAKAAEIRVPVLCGVGDADAMIEGNDAVMGQFAAAFERAERKEWTVMKGALHAIELSWYSPSWYARCCDFAMGCAVEAEMAK